MKKNNLMKLMALGCTAALLTGCGAGESGTESTGANSPSKDTYEISLSTPHIETTPMAQQIAWFAEEVKAKTDGRMTINVFYSNTLGNQKDMFTQLSNGEIEMIMDGTVTVDYYAPEYGFLTAPYLIEDADHMKAIINSDIFDGFNGKLEENHIEMMAEGVRASRNMITSDKVEFKGLDNINQVVIRMPDNATYIKAWESLGASVQILGGGEVYSSMQTGVINAAEGPYEQFLEQKLDEVGKYIYNTQHTTEFVGIYVSKEWYDALPDDIKTVISDTAKEAMEKATTQSLEEDEQNKQTLLDAGLTFIEIDTEPMLKKLESVWEQKFESEWTGSTYDDVISYAK